MKLKTTLRVTLGLTVLSALSACSGFEIGTKAWIQRVDSSQSSQKTFRQSVPLKCWLIPCPPQDQNQTEKEGS